MSISAPPSPAAPSPATENIIEAKEAAKAQAPTYGVAPGRRHFVLRRVHSLVGLLFGGYVAVHLIVNASGLWPKVYQQNVDKIHALEPMLPLIEIVAIFGPLLFHTVYGIYIAYAGVKFNTTKYNYGGNIRYSLQRWTAVVLLLFLVYHVGTLHKWGFALFGLQAAPDFNPQNLAYQTTAGAIKEPYGDPRLNMAVAAFYLLGIWSAVFHFANGLWTSAIAWGLTVTRKSQERWGHVCLGAGLVLLLAGTTAWVAFAVIGNPALDIDKTRTMPDEESAEVHGQATGGSQTNAPLAPGQNPVQEKKTDTRPTAGH